MPVVLVFPELAAVVVAIMCVLLLLAAVPLAKVLGSLFSRWVPIIGKSVAGAIDNFVGAAVRDASAWLDDGVRPVADFFTGLASSITWVATSTAAAVTAVQSRVAWVFGTFIPTIYAALHGEIAQERSDRTDAITTVERYTEALATKEAADIVAVEDFVSKVVVPKIEGDIHAVESEVSGVIVPGLEDQIARQGAELTSAMADVWAALNPIQQAVAVTLPAQLAGEQQGLAGVESVVTATLPAAIAAVASNVATLEASATECWNPMCSWWSNLEGDLARFASLAGDVGIIAFLARAIHNPAGAAADVLPLSQGLYSGGLSALSGLLAL